MTAGIESKVMYRRISLIHTGATPILINAASVKQQRSSCINRPDTSRIQTAKNHSVSAMEAVLTYVRISELGAQSRLGIVYYLAVRQLLASSLIGRCIRAIGSGEHKSDPWHSTPVATIKSRNASVLSLEEASEQKESNSNMATPVTISKNILTAPFTQHVVQVTTSADRFPTITTIRTLGETFRNGESSPFMTALTMIHNDRFT